MKQSGKNIKITKNKSKLNEYNINDPKLPVGA